MVAVGMGLLWAGFTVGILGWLWISGYDVTFTDLFKTKWPGGQQAATAPAKG